MTTPHRSSGFTLLELMIGLALFGMLLVLLFAAMRFGSRAWDAGESRLAAVSGQGAVAGFMQQALAQVQPWQFKRTEGDVLAFEGEASALRYVGPVVTGQVALGMYMTSFELADSVLRLRWRLPNADTEDFSGLAEREPVVLLRDVESVAFSYYGALEAEQAPAWHDEWRQDRDLPSLIRIRLTPVGAAPWPDIVVAPRVGVSAACIWDDFLQRCIGGDRTLKTPVVAPASPATVPDSSWRR